jgi:hypothetical protein
MGGGIYRGARVCDFLSEDGAQCGSKCGDGLLVLWDC